MHVMKLRVGIPDDTPENTVKSALAILKQEAEQTGAEYKQDEKVIDGFTYSVDVWIKKATNSFNCRFSYTVEVHRTINSSGVGNGSIAGASNWQLYLLYGPEDQGHRLKWNPESQVTRPFRWGMYTKPSPNWDVDAPVCILDGRILRESLRKSLQL
jgi:hypothetical protein